MIGMPGTLEIVIILIVALLLFGKKLPEVARALGKALVEFKRGLREIEDEIKEEDPAKQTKHPQDKNISSDSDRNQPLSDNHTLAG